MRPKQFNRVDSEQRARMRGAPSVYQSRPVGKIVARSIDGIRTQATNTRVSPDIVYSQETILSRAQPAPRRVQKPVIPKAKKNWSWVQTRFVLPALAIIIFIAGGVTSFVSWRTNSTVKAQVEQISQTAEQRNGDSGDAMLPSEQPVNTASFSAFKVSPDLPRFIEIPKIQVDARIKRLGVKANNEMQAPSNIFDTGWYEGSSKPGEAGAILINGHVHGPTKPGVFFGLTKLVPGDEIIVERGDGQRFTYAVVKSQIYSEQKLDMAAALTTIEPGKQGLNLITCAGKLNTSTNEYEDRLIVFAVLK